jgi:PHP family Zn ribbon phosphoesterase
MRQFKADLHIHTVLSPCGSLEMTPRNIVRSACEKGLSIIAITDHNSTRQVAEVKRVGKEQGLFVIGGAEVNTAEEVHCLALFDTDEQLSEFQKYIDIHLRKIKNDTTQFGYQVVVDEDENIVYEERWLLINALDAGIVEVEMKVHALGGLFIPAHIDRPFNGIVSQLGFVPQTLKCDAFELSQRATHSNWKENPKLPEELVFIRSSDAHQPEDIGNQFSILEMETITFEEIKKAFKEQNIQIYAQAVLPLGGS